MYNKKIISTSWLWFILPFIALPFTTNGVSVLSSISLCIALFLLIKYRTSATQVIFKNGYIWLFLALFIPICISYIDALNPKLTGQTIWRLIRYSSYGIIAIFVFKTRNARDNFSTALFWLLIIYCLDAIGQWLFNYNIYGYNPVSNAWHNRVRGVYGESYDLGFFLATLSPFLFFFLLEKIQQKHALYLYLAPISLILLITTIFISGARTALISLLIAGFLFISYCIYQKKFKNYKLITSFLVVGVIGTLIIATQIDVVMTRFSYSINADNLAGLTTNRTNLWHVAWTEFSNYWINGVGARGFNTLYQTYPESYKIFDSVNHPHLHALEVLIETGIIGFIPYIFVCLYLLISFFRSKENNPWLLITFLAIMPINSYGGLYEGNWLPVVFISLAIATTFSQATAKDN